jgi:small-conductance mechanosensitive channel
MHHPFINSTTMLSIDLPRLFILPLNLFCLCLCPLPTSAQDQEIPPVMLPTPYAEGQYFADVLVRGQPVLQIGSLTQLSATERAQIINRRLGSLLARGEVAGSVTPQIHASGSWATLQMNNRVLMTVTEQDAQDYGLTVDALATDWAEQLNQALDKPPLTIDVVQRLNNTIRQLLQDAVDNLPSGLGALIVIGITWGVAKTVRYTAFTWAQHTEGDSSTEVLIGRLGYGGIWMVGSIVALGVLGIDFAALLGALGLTSVAIGFSLKDVLSNYISGVILLAARPFRLGDQVVIKEFEGTISQIQLRATTLITYDGRTVYIPNQEIFQASITNNTASPHRRSSVFVGIDYETDLQQAFDIIQKAVREVPLVETSFPVQVIVKELAASTINLEVWFWADSRRGEFLTITSAVTRAIKESLQQAGIEMPTEIYTLVFRNSPPALGLGPPAD